MGDKNLERERERKRERNIVHYELIYIERKILDVMGLEREIRAYGFRET